MEQSDPMIVDELGYVSIGVLLIIGLVSALWSLYHIFMVGMISWTGLGVGYILVSIIFGIIYGDTWIMSNNAENSAENEEDLE